MRQRHVRTLQQSLIKSQESLSKYAQRKFSVKNEPNLKLSGYIFFASHTFRKDADLFRLRFFCFHVEEGIVQRFSLHIFLLY